MSGNKTHIEIDWEELGAIGGSAWREKHPNATPEQVEEALSMFMNLSKGG